MHSSRMHTGQTLTVFRGVGGSDPGEFLPGPGVGLIPGGGSCLVWGGFLSGLRGVPGWSGGGGAWSGTTPREQNDKLV